MSRSVKPRAPRLGPDDRQRELQRRDAAPGALEVAVLELLELRRARRVIADDRDDQPLAAAPRQSRSRLSRSRIGGAHLNSGAPSGISSAAK